METTITMYHESGITTTVTRVNSEVARTVRLAKQSGYVRFEYTPRAARGLGEFDARFATVAGAKNA